MLKVALPLSMLLSISSFAQGDALRTKVAQSADQVEPKVIAWRRDIHEHPELGNRAGPLGSIALALNALKPAD